MELAVATPVAHEDRKHTAQRIANEMFHQQPDWITFFREVLGVDGLLRKLFNSPEELAAFEKTDEYNEIQLMLARLRERTGAAADGNGPAPGPDGPDRLVESHAPARDELGGPTMETL